MRNLKKTVVITATTLIVLTMLLFGCKKESANITQETPQLTAKGGTFNCYTTVADAASIQLINPVSPKDWFDLSFCFTPPITTSPFALVHRDNDTMNVTLQIFVNRIYLGNKGWTADKIDEYFYEPLFHPYPTPTVRFPQRPNLGPGTYTFPINFKFERKGLYNKFINFPGQTTYDTLRYNYDAYDFGMHDALTNGYAYTRIVIESNKP